MATSALEAELGRRRRPKRRSLEQFPTELPNREQAVPPSAPGSLRSFGLRNMGEPDPILDAYWAAQERAQSMALNPTLAGARNWNQMAGANEPPVSFAESWRSAVPTGPQFPQLFGPPDASRGPTTGGWDDYVGNIPRGIVNAVPGALGEIATGLGQAAAIPLGAAGELWHQATTPVGQLQDEAAAEKERQANITPGARSQLNAVTPEAIAAVTPGAQAPPPLPPAMTGVVPGAAGAAASAPQASGAQAPDLLERSRAAIYGMESAGSGGYSALGPVNPSGDRAYGAGQVMGKNIPSWTSQALGRSLTPQEFLADAAAQDAVFNHIFGGYLASGNPADAASRWFTGQPLEGNEGRTDILGTTAGDYVRRYLDAVGMPLPPDVEPYVPGTPPPVPNPVDAPMPIQPDFSPMNNWLNQANPQAPDPNAQRQMMFNEIINGIAQGNAAVDVRGPGGVGRLLAALGKGAAGGRAYGQEKIRLEDENFKQAQEQYAMDRAKFGQVEANAITDWKNRGQDTMFSNLTRDQAAEYETKKQNYLVGEEGKKSKATADAANRANFYEWKKEAATLGSPTVKVSGNSAWRIYPDGRVEQVAGSAGGGKPTDPLVNAERINKLRGTPVGDEAFYRDLATRGDQPTFARSIMEDVFRAGLGSKIFGQNYTNVEAEQKARLQAETGTLRSFKPDEFKKMLDQAMINELQGMFANDPKWIADAAKANVYGARVWLQLNGAKPGAK